MKFYKDHYDVIVIGGALAGLSSALMLADKGKDVLVLERHNLPGGIASSFVRGGIEIEAALHEMMSIGEKDNRLKVGKFFDDMGVDIEWLKVPEAYHASLPGLCRGWRSRSIPGFPPSPKRWTPSSPAPTTRCWPC